MMKTAAKFLVAIVVSVLLTAALTGCGSKTAQTTDGFTKIMEDAGFEVADVTSQTEMDDLITSILIATGDYYQMEFYVLVDNETCEDIFDQEMKTFDDEHSVKTLSVKHSTNNYNYYAFNSDGDFHMIARIDNTMLYCVADKKYKSEIVELLKTLGYK